ncbi:MAG: EF-P lysine aminoacylase EpmA [Alphaproteobacteria bacterium]
MWWQPHNFERKKPFLEARSKVLRSVRAFFDGQSFQEVETPILQVCPVMDTHIHGFKTEILKPDLTHERDMYLHTSPEFAMKKLMVAGLPRIYQLCHVFRNGEGSRLHSPEFTMLEWYRAPGGYRDIMDDCMGLLRGVANDLEIKEYKYRGILSDPFLNWNIISVSEAFEKYSEIRLGDYLEDTARFSKAVAARGIRVADGDRWDDLFFRVMAEKIEPHLGAGAPAILYDYPVSMASLARKKPEDPRFAERFEMYVCGVEVCNAFGELVDPVEQRKRFHEEIDLKEKLYGYRYPFDEDFLKALEYGLPESGGNALGVDRLVMLASGAEDIDQVLWAGKP